MMATEVMNLTMDFLIAKNLIKNKNTFKELLHRMWFANYPRSHWSNIAGSCAFEHIFLGKLFFFLYIINHIDLGCNCLLVSCQDMNGGFSNILNGVME